MSGLIPVLDGLGNVTFINNLLSSVGVLVSILPGLLQNGNSSLGLLPTPVLPPFLGGSQGIPWGNMTAGGTNVYENTTDTGVTRTYDFTIARATLAPEGIPKEMMLINGQFPGPLIEANWGDMIEVTLTNAITGPEEGTKFCADEEMIRADKPYNRYRASLAWSAPERDPLVRWCAVRPDVPCGAWEIVYLPLQGGSVRVQLVPLAL